MSALAIIDSHVHWWDPARLRYGWLDALPALNRALGREEFQEAAAGANVGKVIFVKAAAGPDKASRKWIGFRRRPERSRA